MEVQDKIIEMDKKIIGVRLFCEFCSFKKVLSPCWCCQYFFKNHQAKYCRGCGAPLCKMENEICKAKFFQRQCGKKD